MALDPTNERNEDMELINDFADDFQYEKDDPTGIQDQDDQEIPPDAEEIARQMGEEAHEGRLVIKRDGREVPFDENKIITAISKANARSDIKAVDKMSQAQIEAAAEIVKKQVFATKAAFHVEEIQDMVQRALIDLHASAVELAYGRYRTEHSLMRRGNTTDAQILSLVNSINEDVKQENANKNPTINSTQRDYIAGEVSKDITNRLLLPPDIVQAHKEGIIHFHDADYFVQHMHNCDLLNLEDMLQNGTVITETMIVKPHSFQTACNIATQIIAQVASNQYGGQTFTLSHLAPFVDVSRKKLWKQVTEERKECGDDLNEDKIRSVVKSRLQQEIASGIQTIQYQLVTLMTTNGQAPFVTMFMYIDEVPEGQTREDLVLIIKETLRQRIKGIQNKYGTWITPAFPKLIYVLDEDNMYPGTKYYDVTVLAARCTAKRMVPDYISAKVMRQLKGDVYTCMGCRSFLTPDNEQQPEGLCNKDNKACAGNYVEGQHKYYGRFNQGVVTLNLVDVACSAEGDMDRFWKILDERLELCHRALKIRHDRLMGTLSDAAPILWQYGALARLQPGEKIDRLLFGNYSTLSLGYAGLYEMCVRMLGVSHTSDEGREFSLSVMQRLNDKYAEWRKAENISYSVYGTPMESTTYKFARCLQRRFGIIPDVTDHSYITNSYHVCVREKIDAFKKLSFEADFQKLSPGGAISYVEVPNMQNNIPAVLAVMEYIYNNIMYAELNTKSDHCEVCGYSGEIKAVDNGFGKYVWECPNCGNLDTKKMVVVRRICGYIGGANDVNQGRMGDIHDRVLHL